MSKRRMTWLKLLREPNLYFAPGMSELSRPGDIGMLSRWIDEA